MKLRDDLNALTPRLRRYARALMTGHPGGSDVVDDLVQATLMRTLGSRTVGTQADLAIRCYATLTQLNREIVLGGGGPATPIGPKPSLVTRQQSATAVPLAVRQSKLTAGLMGLALDDREALLLVALENFGHGDAARILRVSRTTLFARLTRARGALDAQLHARAPNRPADRERHSSYLRLVK